MAGTEATAALEVRVPARLATVLSGIARERGAAVDGAELAEALRLYEAGRRAMAGVGNPGNQAGLLHRAVPFAGCTVRTPTLAAKLKIREVDGWPVPEDLPDADRAEWVTLLVAWVLDHGRDPDELALLTAETVRPVLEGWSAGIGATAAELRAAIGEVTRGLYPVLDFAADGAAVVTDADIDWAAVLLTLITEGGGTLSEWLAEYEPAVWHLMAALRRRRDAERRAADPKAPPGSDDPRVLASAAWHAFEERLRARRGPAPADQPEEEPAANG